MKKENSTGWVLAIAGGTGSGKSWMAARLAEQLGGLAILVQSDWYYRDRSGVRGRAALKLNFDHPGAIEARLLARHLARLRRGDPVDAPQYDYATHARLGRTIRIEPARLVIVEGLFVLHEPVIRAVTDFGLFLDVDAEQRLIHRLKRDQAARNIPVTETLRLYETFARPMHERFVQPSRRWADEVWNGLASEARVRKFARKLRGRLSR